MRNLNLLDRYRLRGADIIAHYGWAGDHECGAFEVNSPVDGGTLRVIASVGEGWDHVSVSRVNRCPNWPEMEQVKRLFFKDEETAMQLHVPPSDHINVHPYCLHLWRPLSAEVPRPPAWMVGEVRKSAVDDLTREKIAALGPEAEKILALHPT